MPTISDVAIRAGVSPATVSRVIRGAANVRSATRKRVLHAIEELGYVPSAAAQSLRSKRTRSLALVLPDITNTFWTTVARGVEDVAHQHDYAVLLCNTDEDLAKQYRYLDFLIGQQVDGVIIAPHDSDARHLDKLRQRDIPTVLVDRRIQGWDVDGVIADSVSGARALVRHLVDLGHRRIAVVSGPATTSTAEDRVAGYCLALAEANIPVDQRLIRRGEFRTTSGEELTLQLLDEGLRPTAIFATNNPIAMGVIAALEQRGLRIPQELALVCYDDIPIVSRFFPFLTAVDQPAYDMGLNAAQLLLSRLDSEVPLQPRHVVLPTRLIVRHSCGHTLREGREDVLSVPLPKNDLVPATMVKPLSSEERREAPSYTGGVQIASIDRRHSRLSERDQSDVNRLLLGLHHREADRLPHLELYVRSRRLVEYILEHELAVDRMGTALGGTSLAPEDQVEFAMRLGMDAICCHLAWRPRGNSPDDLESPPSLSDQLSYLERYLRAVQGSGLGVIATVSGFCDTALRGAAGNTMLAEQLMDTILNQQAKVMRVLCDRFVDDLALVVVVDDIADAAGTMLPAKQFHDLFPRRMQRLIAPTKEHRKLVVLHSDGNLGDALQVLHEVGFDAVHPLAPECNDIFQIRSQWLGRLAIMGNMPTSTLVSGRKAEIEEVVRDYCLRLAPGGGYVFSTANGVVDAVPPENFVAMTQAIHRYGRYASLGQDGPGHGA